jgi:uncharacterized protein (TIGR03067 family)
MTPMYRKLFVVAAAMLLAGCAAAPVREPARVAISDANLNGTWIVKQAEFAGRSLPVPPGIELQINGNQYSVASLTNRALPTDRGGIVVFIDGSAGQTGHIDVIGEDGPNQGKRFPAIYRFVGNLNERELEMCYDLSGKLRPTEFASPEGTLLLRVTYVGKRGG